MAQIKLIRFQRFFRSIFTKLIFINLVAWFLILLAVVFAFFFSRSGEKGPFYKNVSQYIQYIIHDLGTPPQKENGVKIHNKTGVHISFSGENSRWTTRDHFPDIDKIHFHSFHGNEGDKVQFSGKYGRHSLRVQVDAGLLFFEFAGGAEEDLRQKVGHLLLLLLLSIILLGCYLTLKKLLFPLKELGAGVAEVASGNLSHQVPIQRNDELSELARSFNDMTLKLKKMMQTKEHLLRDISHELRSPLTRIKVALELIDESETKKGIEQDVVEMEEMITTILESARDHHDSRKQNLVQCDLNRILKKVAEKYSNITPGVQYVSDETTLYCMADESSLNTVFTNIIDNSVKFSAGQGRAIEVKLKKTENRGLVTVRDYGGGIEKSELSFIFEPFYRVDKSRSRQTGGFGLGLSLCKTIIESHGGKIEVKSIVGEGTTFLITLPLIKV